MNRTTAFYKKKSESNNYISSINENLNPLTEWPQKKSFVGKIEEILNSRGFDIDSKDLSRPWGGFFVIKESQAQEFSDQFFNGLNVENLKIGGKLSPKILVVNPKARLSWQYHNRRAEIWQIIHGTAGVVASETDNQGELKKYKTGDQITLKQGERHRLIGLDTFCVVAEIWQHTDPENPSNENDIIRVQDDYNRSAKA